jgi:hypothetical protein
MMMAMASMPIQRSCVLRMLALEGLEAVDADEARERPRRVASFDLEATAQSSARTNTSLAAPVELSVTEPEQTTPNAIAHCHIRSSYLRESLEGRPLLSVRAAAFLVLARRIGAQARAVMSHEIERI